MKLTTKGWQNDIKSSEALMAIEKNLSTLNHEDRVRVIWAIAQLATSYDELADMATQITRRQQSISADLIFRPRS